MPHYNLRPRQSLDHLLTAHDDSEMDTLPAKTAHATNRISSVESVPPGIASSGTPPSLLPHDDHQTVPVHYRLYKRRFFGLFQLVLLNIIVSWDWLTFSAVSKTASDFFHVSESSVNWLSTGFLFAFVAVSPLVIWIISHGGPRAAIIAAALLTLVGNWLRYAGTRIGTHGSFGVTVLGQIIIGFAQPFVLCAPTRYSQTWFSDKGRVSATAIASLANPFGGALGQLIGPLWTTDQTSIPRMVLYTAILSSVASLPAFFVPARPPTPPSASAAEEKLELFGTLKQLRRNSAFYLVLVPFSVYVGFFNATSSLLNQIFEPYGFSETEAGIAGAILIVVGLVASAIVSPLVDRTKEYLVTIKILVPLTAIGYLILVFAPQTHSIVAAYIVCALIGAASFSLLPCALEYLVEITYPVSPEVSSTLCWAGGQLLGAVFIIIMDALKGGWQGESEDQPPANMKRALVFQAAVAWAAVPFALLLGVVGVGAKGRIMLGRVVTDGSAGDEGEEEAARLD